MPRAILAVPDSPAFLKCSSPNVHRPDGDGQAGLLPIVDLPRLAALRAGRVVISGSVGPQRDASLVEAVADGHPPTPN